MQDFSAARVGRQRTDPSRIISSIMATGESVAKSELEGYRALGRGVEQAGAAIGEGLAKRNDPAEKLRRKQIAAASTDADARTAADQMRAGARTMSARDAETAATGAAQDDDTYARAAATQAFGGSLPWDKMTDAQRGVVRATVAAHRDRTSLVREGDDDAAAKLGRYGDPDYVGRTAGQVGRDTSAAVGAELRALGVQHPLLRASIAAEADKQAAAQMARARGAPGLAAFVTARGADDATLSKGDVFQRAWDDTAVRAWATADGGTKFGTFRQIVNDGDFEDARFRSKNRSETRDRAPRIGLIKGANGRDVIHDSVDDDVVEQFGKNTVERRLAEKSVGMATDALNAQVVGYRASLDAVQKFLNRPAALREGATDEEVGSRAAANTLRAMVAEKTVTVEQLGALLAKRNGLADVSAAELGGSGLLMDAKGITRADQMLATILRDGRAAAALSPTKGGAFEEQLGASYERSMARGQFPGRAGALGWLDGSGLTDGDAIEAARTWSTAEAQSPEYGIFRDRLRAVAGFQPADAERFARSHFAAYDTELERRKTGFTTSDGRRFAELAPDEQAAVAHGLADALMDDLTGAASSQRTAAARLAADGGRDDLTVDRVAADGIARDAAQPGAVGTTQIVELDDGTQIEARDGSARTIRTVDGRTIKMGAREGDGAADASWRAAFRMAAETTAADEWGHKIADASLGASSEVVRGLMSPEFTSNLSEMMRRGVRDGDGPALRAATEAWMARAGVSAVQLRDELNREWAARANPYVGAMAAYVAGMLSPDRTTTADLDEIQGSRPTKTMMKAADDGAAQDFGGTRAYLSTVEMPPARKAERGITGPGPLHPPNHDMAQFDPEWFKSTIGADTRPAMRDQQDPGNVGPDHFDIRFGPNPDARVEKR